ncbi:MAG: phage shock protein operon transcriptional activator, partial [Proteobacteria bacterium]|nr:phage shock protein operon transcriptional activator [Pseudomonadota bacterium]
LVPASTEATAPIVLPDDFRAAVASYESDLLTRALREARHNQRAAAKRLGLGYHQLRNLLRKHGLMPAREKD